LCETTLPPGTTPLAAKQICAAAGRRASFLDVNPGFARRSEHISVSGLGKFLVGDHLVLETNKDLLEGVSGVPVGEHVELALLDHSIRLVDAGQVQLRVELDLGRGGGVGLVAGDGHHVDAVIESGVGGADNGSVPVGERLIVA